MTSKLKPEQLVKELSKKKSNKNCFDCGRSGPQQNVNTTLNTFVCTQCAGIHRKFNHKVKTINMSTFTPSEVDALENGGNKRARKIWLATFDELKSYQLDPEDPNNIDRFMQLVYVDKKWAKPANAPVEEEDKKPKKKRKDSNVPDAFETTFPASVAITSTPAAAASKSAPQQSTPPKSQPTVDLGIDFLSNLTISTPAPAQQPASASTSQPFQSNDFGSNGLFDAPTATSNGTTSDPVDEFVAFFKRQQQQHNVSPSTVAGWVQKALATFSNGRAAAASSSFDASTANSAASNSQAAFQPQQQPQHQDAFADIDIPGEEDGDTGNPFDSSDDEDEPQPNGNCQNKYNAPITPALNQNFQQQQFNAHQQAQAQAQAQAQMQYQQMMYQQQMLAAQQQQMGSFGVPNGGFVPQQGYSPMNAFGQQSHQHPPTSQPPQFTVSQAQPNTQQPEHPPKPDLFAGLGGIGAF